MQTTVRDSRRRRSSPPAIGAKATNLSLLALSFAAAATGVASFLVGSPELVLIIWLHATAGFTLLLLFYWKRRIIYRSIRRQGLGPWAVPSVALLVLVLGALGTGVAWSTFGLPDFGPYSGLTVHAVLGVSILLFLAVHAASHWPRVTRRDITGRRALLRTAALVGAGAVAWRGTDLFSSVAGLSGAARRFTGSRQVVAGIGNDFPQSNWLTDDPAPLDLSAWRLKVTGHVERELTLALSDLSNEASVRTILDCTGGWYVERTWQGAALADLLQQAGVRNGAHSVVVRSSTGYWRRYTLRDARATLLATRVGGETLTHAHGAPLRVVHSGKRGYEWVKWVTEIEVSTASPLLKWPLPIS
jgi:DMSO/TMAO reductase YedYZ molybdopterin-dependent catalytic subunit